MSNFPYDSYKNPDGISENQKSAFLIRKEQLLAEQEIPRKPRASLPVLDQESVGKKKGKKKKHLVTAVIAACMILSITGGYIGGRLSSPSGLQSQSAGTESSLNNSLLDTAAKNLSEGIDLTLPQIAELTMQSVVEITTETVQSDYRMKQFVSQGAGSGVILSADGYIVTNYHVIEGASKITVRLKNGKSYDGAVVGSDKKTDIAVIKINAEKLQPAVLGDSSKLTVGELAVAVGNPLGELGGTVTDGIISALDRTITIEGKSMTLLQTNAAINPGNSGGGLFNSKGQLIGIVNSKSSGSGIEGLGFAIPINSVKDIISQIISQGYVEGRIDLGMELVEILNNQTALSYGVWEQGLYIETVVSGSKAQQAGLRNGDRILSIEGTDVLSSADFQKVLENYKVGDTVQLVISRGGRRYTCSLELVQDNRLS